MPLAHRRDAQISRDQGGTGGPIMLLMGHTYGADMCTRFSGRLRRLVGRPGEETPAGSRLNDLDSRVLALAPTWMTGEEAPASGFTSDSEMK